MSNNMDILDFVKRYFYGEIEKIKIVDIDKRETYDLKDMTISQISSYNTDRIDGIIIENNIIYIKY